MCQRDIAWAGGTRAHGNAKEPLEAHSQEAVIALDLYSSVSSLGNLFHISIIIL